MALHEINSDLKTAESTLKHWESTYPGLVRAEAKAKADHEIEWAQTIEQIVAEYTAKDAKLPTVGVLEAEATKRCADKIRAKRMAEAEVEIGKKLIGIAETTLTSIQSRLKLEQIEAGLSGVRT